MKLVIEIPDNVVHGLKDLGFDEHQAAQLVRDALGEFISSRHPISDYVDRRYKDMGVHFRADKKGEVLKRTTWATFVKAGIVKLLEDT